METRVWPIKAFEKGSLINVQFRVEFGGGDQVNGQMYSGEFRGADYVPTRPAAKPRVRSQVRERESSVFVVEERRTSR